MGKVLLFILLLSLAMVSLANQQPPISENPRKWVRRRVDPNSCHEICAEKGGHLCMGFHNYSCCEKVWKSNEYFDSIIVNKMISIIMFGPAEKDCKFNKVIYN